MIFLLCIQQKEDPSEELKDVDKTDPADDKTDPPAADSEKKLKSKIINKLIELIKNNEDKLRKKRIFKAKAKILQGIAQTPHQKSNHNVFESLYNFSYVLCYCDSMSSLITVN